MDGFDILQLPLANDIDLEPIAYMTEGFSGADLQALLSDAQLAAVHEHLDSINANEPAQKPIITNDLLKATAGKARPSVSETEKQRLYGIYRQFLDAKKSVSAQVPTTFFFFCFLLINLKRHNKVLGLNIILVDVVLTFSMVVLLTLVYFDLCT